MFAFIAKETFLLALWKYHMWRSHEVRFEDSQSKSAAKRESFFHVNPTNFESYECLK